MSQQPIILRGFNQAARAFEEFVHRQSFSGILLILCSLAAFILANSHFAYHYFDINQAKVGWHYEQFRFEKSLQHWVNDGWMAVFFLLVGLEIKREIIAGELSAFNKAILPVAAAIGGMVIPALVYVACNYQHPQNLSGWGTPMATDIAFALGVLSLLGKRVPRSLMVFLTAVAIVDDLGAVLVIALFYTQQLHFWYIAASAILCFGLLMLNRLRVHRLSPYLFLGALLWYMLLHSGVHATIAGVLLALAIPARSYYETQSVHDKLGHLMQQFTQLKKAPGATIDIGRRKDILQTIEALTREVETPLQRLEHILHAPVTYFIIPAFVLINAGVSLKGVAVLSLLHHPITLGIMAGLILGKALGIFGTCFILVKTRLVQLPKGVNLKLLFPLSLLAGIGFTMSIFIAELAFPGNAKFLMLAKTGILFASVIAALLGYAIMWLFTQPTSSRRM